jgi:biopolymer transport protein ExbD
MAHQSRAQKARNATRMAPEEEPEFQIAPMIDILLVLLIFFMSIATDQVLQVNKDVVLPMAKDGQDAETKKTSELMVNITWSDIGQKGAIIVDDKEMDSVTLTSRVKAMQTSASSQGKDFRVVIRADKSARYAYTKEVMRAVGAGDVGKITFSVVDKEVEKAKK